MNTLRKLVLVVLSVCSFSALFATNYVVTSAADDGSGITLVSGVPTGTLRAVVTAANGDDNALPHSITFDPTALPVGTTTIQLTSPLPSIIMPMIIDGNPSNTTAPITQCIRIIGTGSGFAFDIEASGCTLKNLALYNFGQVPTITPSCSVTDNSLSSPATIFINAPNVTINQCVIAISNVAITVNAADATISSCYLGVDESGSISNTISYAGGNSPALSYGIVATCNATALTIGGSSAALGNIITTGNENNNNIAGVKAINLLASNSVTIENNTLGKDKYGTAQATGTNTTAISAAQAETLTVGSVGNGNYITGFVNGVFVNSSSLTTPPTSINGNTIYNVSGTPVSIENSSNITVQGNILDAQQASNGVIYLTNVTTAHLLSNYIQTVLANNANIGFSIVNSTGITIGGSSQGNGNILTNVTTGIYLTSSPGTVIQGNTIGLSADGTNASTNQMQTGIQFSDNNSTGVLIGGAGFAGNTIANGGSGILLENGGSNTLNLIIQGNKFGTNVTGTKSLPLTSAFSMAGSSGITIGYPAGAIIDEAKSLGNIIENCNGGEISFFLFCSQLNMIGNTFNNNFAFGNVFANCSAYVISNNTFTNNNQTSQNSRGEGILAIFSGTNGTISSNTFTNNFAPALYLTSTTNTQVSSNYVGTDSNWDYAFAGINFGDGITISGGCSTITITGNYIANNPGNGISIQGSSNNIITGNYIGVNPNNLTSIGYVNGGYGISINQGSNNNQIGGKKSGQSNTISYYGQDGINISGFENTISENTIFNINNNGGIGIDLNLGASVPGNGSKGAPTIQNIVAAGDENTVTISGITSGQSDTIQLYMSDATGKNANKYLGSVVANNGAWSTNLVVGQKTDYIIATATDPSTGNTSQFSTVASFTPCNVVTNTNDAGAGSLRAAILCGNASGATATNPYIINFNLPSGQNTIQLQSSLPALQAPMIINGQSANTSYIRLENGGILDIEAPSCTIENLSFYGFYGQPNATALASCSSLVNSNYINNGVSIFINAASATINNCIIHDAGAGILVNANYATITSCYLGTDETGNSGNTLLFANPGVLYGIIASCNANNLQIGGNSPSLGNIITRGSNGVGNPSAYGIMLFNNNQVTIQNNILGKDKFNAVQNLNAGNGITITGATEIWAGEIGNGNNINYYSQAGISIANACSTIYVQGNLVYNCNIQANGSSNIFIQNNIMDSEGLGTGGAIVITNVTTAQVQGNLIQTNFTYTIDTGINLSNSSGIVIGGGGHGNGNIISNTTNAIELDACPGTIIQGNITGLTPDGSKASVGTNLISGVQFVDNPSDYVQIIGNTMSNAEFAVLGNTNTVGNNLIIQGNNFGTDITGTNPIPISIYAIYLGNATNAMIGGLTTGEQNIIATSKDAGIFMSGASQSKVLGNYIGTNSSWAAGLGNSGNGITLQNCSTVTVTANYIVANTGNGISLQSSFGNIITANYIGINPNSPLSTSYANSGQGIAISQNSNNNQIGGKVSGQPNFIAYNTGDGINISQNSASNFISQNPIYKNGGLGIDLNLSLSGNTGNNSKAVPQYSGQSYAGTNLTLTGTSAAGDTIEIYSSDVNGINAYSYIVSAITDGSGNWSAIIPASQLQPGNNYFIATATDNLGNTSQFSAPILFNHCAYAISLSVTSAASTVCQGSATQLNAIVNPIQGPFTFQWSPANNLNNSQILNPVAKVLGTTTYTVTVTSSSNGCSVQGSVTVNTYPLPQVSALNTVGVSCQGKSDGTVSFDVGSSTAPYSVILSGGNIQGTVNLGSTYSYSGLSQSGYYITVTDANSCVDVQPFSIGYGGPYFSSVCNDYTGCSGATITPASPSFIVSRSNPTGTGAYTYSVTDQNNQPVSIPNNHGAFGASESIPGVGAGQYNVTIIADNGCSISTPSPLVVQPLAVTIAASAQVSNSTYTLTNNGVVSICVNPSCATNVTIQAQLNLPGNSCTTLNGYAQNFSLSVLTAGTYTPVSGSPVSLSQSGQATFSIPPGSVYGSYMLTGTIEGFNCSATMNFQLQQVPNPNINLQIKHETCPGKGDGAAQVFTSQNLVYPVTYTWYTGTTGSCGGTPITMGGKNITTASIGNLPPGNYCVQIADNSGASYCQCFPFQILDGTKYVPGYAVGQYMPAPAPGQPPISFLPRTLLTSSVSNQQCSATATAINGTPPYSFTWVYTNTSATPVAPPVTISNVSGPNATSTVNNIMPGSYQVFVSDLCTVTPQENDFTIVAPARSYNLCFRWKTGVYPTPQIISDPVTTEGLTDIGVATTAMSQAFDEQAQNCVSSTVDAIASQAGQKCLSSDFFSDELDLTYNINYQHFTLYYYDRAGMLVRTVAPQGVNTSATDRSVVPLRHTYVTTYDYNNLEQLTTQQSPDADLSTFIYNDLGQLRFSQNGKQRDPSENATGINRYSYTKYDYLGRIVEVGESNYNTGATTFASLTTNQDDNTYPQSNTSQQTYTVYTNPVDTISYFGAAQSFLRNRVSYSYTRNMNGDMAYNYFSYDPHGNVQWLVSDIPGLTKTYLGYEYDLISNKMLKVKYNEKFADKFFHSYFYDEDNRIDSVLTSHDGFIWDRDADYDYYAHGPLRRGQIGEDNIQGLDYVYTLQGWLKGINSPDLATNGLEGPSQLFAQDKFSSVLGYYQGDFYRKNPVGASSKFNSFNPTVTTTGVNSPFVLSNGGKDLFNGNISAWTTNSNANAALLYNNTLTGQAFVYDRLNRISASVFSAFNGATNAFNAPLGDFSSAYTYDGNGNITNLIRSGNLTSGLPMDNIAYSNATINGLPSNQLKQVADAVGSTAYGDDIEGTINYTYDKNGNLINDNNYIITWNVYGKISQMKPVDSTAATTKPVIRFSYDAMGRRIKKEVNTTPYTSGVYTRNAPNITTTFYALDASGNTMAIYERNNVNLNPPNPNFLAANYTMTEVPLYGSDRLGEYNPNLLVASPVFTSYNAANYGGYTNSYQNIKSEYYNWITMTADGNGTANINQVKYNSTADAYTATVLNSFSSCQATNTALYEDTSGNLQLFAVNAVVSGNNICKVYNGQGTLLPINSPYSAIQADPLSKPVIIQYQQGTPSQYLIFTEYSGQLYYSLVDMSAGAVLQTNVQLDAANNSNYAGRLIAIEDFVNNKAILYASQFTQSTDGVSPGSRQLVSFTFATGNPITQTATPQQQSISSVDASGELKISPDGTKLAVVNYTGYNGFIVKNTEVRVYSMDNNYNLATTSAPLILGGLNAGALSAEFSKDSRYVIYSDQNIAIPQGGTLSQTYDLFSFNYVANVQSGNSAIDDGDLLRGIDGRIYQADINDALISSYQPDISGNPYAAAKNVTLALPGFGGLPVQNHRIYKQYNPLFIGNRTVGLKQYELKDHLGNVAMTVSDVRELDVLNNDGSTQTEANVLFAASYYPFGSQMPGRTFSPGEYRYGFNGKEHDDDVSGTSGVDYNFGDREYDARLGRWFSIDPSQGEYPNESPYCFAFNSPISFKDDDGRDGVLIVFPDYKVDPEIKVTIFGKAFKMPKVPLGHAGVLLIDNKTGTTKYYEFGRYPTKDGTKGRVRKITVSNVILGTDGKPTRESLNKVLGEISQKAGHGGRIRGAYVASDKYKEMNNYAQEKYKESNPGSKEYDKDRQPYELTSNNCGTFAADVICQDPAVDKPVIYDPSPPNIVDEFIEEGHEEITYDPKTKTTTGEGEKTNAGKKANKKKKKSTGTKKVKQN